MDDFRSKENAIEEYKNFLKGRVEEKYIANQRCGIGSKSVKLAFKKQLLTQAIVKNTNCLFVLAEE